ncbi:MAG: Fic family protein [Oscillospiraceae bacterium]|nr:Fic family protein [Oscillospiraceae bacterium]
MDYPVLKKLYYKNREAYLKEATERPKSLSATPLPLDIHHAPAYYVNCPELVQLVSDCYRTAARLKEEVRRLPTVAHRFYQRNCLIDEVKLSLDLEGVRSTRKEISELLDAESRSEEKARRLFGMVRKYEKLLDEQNEVNLGGCAQIRQLYDELVRSEIAEKNLPDGRCFRNGPVSVVSATDKEKHQGLAPPEENIIRHMEAALGLIENEEIPPLIAIALLHYFIGYIHPFYDGNGRLSRFISSYLLMRDFDELTALRLSYAIKDQKGKYYDAFDLVNDPKNKGDTTPFILMFLEIVLAAEESLIAKLDRGLEKLSFYLNLIEVLVQELGSDKMELLCVLIQNEMFGDEALPLKTLAEAANLSIGKARACLKQMAEVELGEAVQIKRDGHKYVYSVDLEKLETVCGEATGA